ncbi:uncharacterized protein LOC131687339 [Topomyia yanbarensis]|uniref:uncharacterized protein LOC131687339 n=1 Tax=Topomyia yanbarensis TaxID=2498891 RepID=UPI00273B4BC3|nr:uncharacterized protein LOC131687339 [Topomyia yanbarensis]
MVKLLVLAFSMGIALCAVVKTPNNYGPYIRDVIETVTCVFRSVKITYGKLQKYPNNCRLFIFCMNDVGIVRECPNGLYFNPVEKLCDLPENVDCEDPTETTTDENGEGSTTETGNTTETTEEGIPSTTGDQTTNGETSIDTTTSDEPTIENTTVEGTTSTTTADQTTNDEPTNEDTTIEGTTSSTTVDQTTNGETSVETTTIEEPTNGDTTVEGTTIAPTTSDEPTDEDTTVEETTSSTTVDQTTNGETSVETITSEDPTNGETTVEGTTIAPTTSDEPTDEDTTVEGTTSSTTVDQTTNGETSIETTTSTTVDEETSTTTVTEEICEPLCTVLPMYGGEVAHPEYCERYISCVNSCDGATSFCPASLLFNHFMSVCDISERAECILEVCVGKETGTLASVNSCRHYFVCLLESALLRSCGDGLVFDPSQLVCVQEDESNTCNIPDIPPAPPEVMVECEESVQLQNLRHPELCNVYYRCVRGNIFPRQCQPGLFFDEVKQACNLAELVDCTMT